MKKILLALVVILVADISYAADWNPVGEYKKGWMCDEGKAFYTLKIAPHPQKSRDVQKRYYVTITSSSCRAACVFKGIGVVQADILKAKPTKPLTPAECREVNKQGHSWLCPEVHREYWQDCEIVISKNKSGITIRESKPNACESYYLCGNAGLDIDDLGKSKEP